MKLSAVTIQMFRNFVNPQRITIEDDVTSLVGKNESGKTTILQALHRLKPANNVIKGFDLTTEYPRWRLSRDKKKDPELARINPIVAEFAVQDDDKTKLEELFQVGIPPNMTILAAIDYNNQHIAWVTLDLAETIKMVAQEADVKEEDRNVLLNCKTFDDTLNASKELSKNLKAEDALRSKAVISFSSLFAKYQTLFLGKQLDTEHQEQLWTLVPRFFYFSNYNMLPGECDLYELSAKIKANQPLKDAERTVVALLAHAGETPGDFMDEDYDSRKAELQAASSDLSRSVFKYWKQNPDLSVVFDTDNVVVRVDPNGNEITHRILKIELRDARHGDVETNFSTRSTGFQWFFSFFAAFSEYQEMKETIVVLLDEPGTSLHGDAQRDYVRFIFEELGASKQTIYTTHSQHMVDPTKYEKFRAVHDQATKENPDLGVVVTDVSLSADRSTVLPLESALGYSVSQHLFIGSGQHLVVEGSSDFVYLQRMTEYFLRQQKTGLDPRFSMIPVGGIDNMPAFVALLGRRLKVSVLVDGAKTNNKINRIKSAAKDNEVPESNIIACSEVSGVVANADIEDLFDPEDYLRLFNWAFNSGLEVSHLASTNEPILKKVTDRYGEYDHALPAHALTDHREEFFSLVKPTSIERFEELFQILNKTVML